MGKVEFDRREKKRKMPRLAVMVCITCVCVDVLRTVDGGRGSETISMLKESKEGLER